MSLSPAQIEVIGQVVRACPDDALSHLNKALAGARGGAMGRVRDLVAEEAADRRVRDAVLEPYLPLFAAKGESELLPRPPKRALRALWSAMREHDLERVAEAGQALAFLQPDDPTPESFDALCVSAAEMLRDAPETLGSDQGFAEPLAGILSLAPQARAGVRRLPEWLGRVTDERAAALRLTLKDATETVDDATPKLLELWSLHLPHPRLVLRLISAATHRAGDKFLAGSELRRFGERLLDEVEAGIARVRAFDPSEGARAAAEVGALVARVCETLAEMEQQIDLAREGPWGRRVADARRSLAAAVEGRLREVDKAVGLALPLQTVRLTGRMTRQAPKIGAAPETPRVERARALLTLMDASRSSAGVGGYGALRAQAAEETGSRLHAYADEVLHLLNSGEAPDEPVARDYLDIAAEFLGLSLGEEAERLVRRRAAVAGAPSVSQESA